MQVTHANDHVTHAVISAGDTIDFSISGSAEFFHILSSTLYTDQILAVARETLCNAWDAHIESGRTDIPVSVTIDNDKLVIRDYGAGIPHSMIGPIYGTYGNSTKKNDGQQTGGFGLGCKSPFAYGDHFDVESIHQGTRTLYLMSKSSAEAQGKPAITTILQVPAVGEGSADGLKVSLRMKNSHDANRFKRLIERLARNGDMNVKLNGHLVKRIGFDATKASWFLHTHSDLLESQNDAILVRYGNVVYPIEVNQEVKPWLYKAGAFLEKLNRRRYGSHYRLLLQAPPHSLSVTPITGNQPVVLNLPEEILPEDPTEEDEEELEEALEELEDLEEDDGETIVPSKEAIIEKGDALPETRAEEGKPLAPPVDPRQIAEKVVQISDRQRRINELAATIQANVKGTGVAAALAELVEIKKIAKRPWNQLGVPESVLKMLPSRSILTERQPQARSGKDGQVKVKPNAEDKTRTKTVQNKIPSITKDYVRQDGGNTPSESGGPVAKIAILMKQFLDSQDNLGRAADLAKEIAAVKKAAKKGWSTLGVTEGQLKLIKGLLD